MSRSKRTAVVAAAAVLIPVAAAVPAQAAPGDAGTAVTEPVVLVAEGGTARVGVRLTVEGGGTLPAPLAVPWSTAAGTATAGADFRAARGTLRFPTGTRSGTVQYVPVRTTADRAAETAETITVTAGTATAQVVINAHGLPYLDESLPVARRVTDLLARMTLEEKAGQMAQAERNQAAPNPALITDAKLGSILNGGSSMPAVNTPEAWADMIDGFQRRALATRLQIPLIYGVDSVHGRGNLYGATIFPHNLGLGATRDPALVSRTAHLTAKETRATGIPWNFAPCLCVARDDRWGRTYESFGETPELVTTYASSVDGFQGTRPGQLRDADRVLATAKHFAGDGDTEYGTGEGAYTLDQGDTVANRADFHRINVAPFEPAVRRHRVGSVMPSFSTVTYTDGPAAGQRIDMHAHTELITGELKGRLGFDGIVVSDWQGIQDNDDVTGLSADDVRMGVNAGIDMFMQPSNSPLFIRLLLAEVAAGTVPVARLDDAVRRILTKKMQLGLFAAPFADRRHAADIGSAAHR
ncbi:glycoside hydrolase family 3 protein, partial [Spirilliplanes yamanashiensis]